ncbi:MAG: chemotaxis protein, partial [Deferribacterota bacterium]|nr:chemotaxis protein [Deferribacterota bacterium]
VIEGQGVCFDMITFLEFQDVIKNRINKLVNVLKEVEQHLIELFNKIEVDERKWLGETAENVEKETKTSQDEIDRLLKEFGL